MHTDSASVEAAAAALFAPSTPRLPPSKPWLLIGVSSLPGKTAQAQSSSMQRREAIRSLVSAPSGVADIKFVMAKTAVAADSTRGDVVLFDVPEQDIYTTRKLFLQNAFFRWAVSPACSGSYSIIARADDDSMYNATHLARLLAPFRSDPYLCYGPFRNWYMWDPATMFHTCWQYKGTTRFGGGLTKWRNLTGVKVPYEGVVPVGASLHECFRGGTVGPYPFIAGPFVAYSRQLLSELVVRPRLAQDEAFVLGNRSRTALLSPVDGRMHAPGQKNHPARQVLLEDVYYGYLLFTEFSDKPLRFINMPISDYRRAPPALFNAHVYHKLKTPEHFGYVRNHSAELLRLSLKESVRCDDAWGKKLHRFVRHCRNWTLCMFYNGGRQSTGDAMQQAIEEASAMTNTLTAAPAETQPLNVPRSAQEGTRAPSGGKLVRGLRAVHGRTAESGIARRDVIRG